MFRIGDTRLHTGAVPPDREYLVFSLAALRCPTQGLKLSYWRKYSLDPWQAL